MGDVTELRTRNDVILGFDGRVVEVFDNGEDTWRCHASMIVVDRGDWSRDGSKRRVVLQKTKLGSRKNVHVVAEEWPEVERFLDLLG